MRTLFGTDGIRGTANRGSMTAEQMMRVAIATARQFQPTAHHNKVMIGKDTRLSGYLLEPALTAGFISAGMDVVLLGPVPTPAVAQLTRSLRADLGVMLSASHNPYYDNGIKLFGPDGYKLSDEFEKGIETKLAELSEADLARPHELGRASRLDDAAGRYIEFCKSTFPRHLRLDGVKIVVDCANGAAYKIAPKVFWELGAEVIPLADQPDGLNINAGCGATDTEALQRAVPYYKADLGIALDGDADRLVMVDETGKPVNGDQLLALMAADWQEKGLLKHDTVVATVMSNLGMERFLTARGIALHRTAVGDRYVVEAMRQGGFNLGGEQSGHMVMSDYATTGDGIIAALQVLSILCAKKRPASEGLQAFTPLPQILKNVKLQAGQDPLSEPTFQAAMRDAEIRLNGHGRLLVRKSGTESLLRIMAEGEEAGMLENLCNGLAAQIAA